VGKKLMLDKMQVAAGCLVLIEVSWFGAGSEQRIALQVDAGLAP
jgi:hypothetical protein